MRINGVCVIVRNFKATRQQLDRMSMKTHTFKVWYIALFTSSLIACTEQVSGPSKLTALVPPAVVESGSAPKKSDVGLRVSEGATPAMISLGEALFNDVSLSRDGSQACASCHDIDKGFADSRVNISSLSANIPGSGSLGQDGISLGDINTPAIAYVSHGPVFHFDQGEEESLYKGGFFLNGRASTLIDQAKQPFLNPIEMQTTADAVVAKVENAYSSQMYAIFGENIFDDVDTAFTAIAQSIAAFESTPLFAPFDSKFDRVLKGEDEFSVIETKGKEIFEAEDKGNCIACHILPELNGAPKDSLFTDYTYDNLGVPANENLRGLNGSKSNHIDQGLLANPGVSDAELKGAFRVVSLRNVAVTAPYMHNGVFAELRTVVEFYNTRDVVDGINPETSKPWRKAEVATTMNTEELGDLKLTSDEIEAMVAFMKTFTDRRYEHLL